MKMKQQSKSNRNWELLFHWLVSETDLTPKEVETACRRTIALKQEEKSLTKGEDN